MTPEIFLSNVLRTAAPHHLHVGDMTIHLGLRGETGEVADVVKKAIGHGQGWLPFTDGKGKLVDHRANMIKELGDCSWYGAAQLHRFDATRAMNVTGIEFTDSLEDLAILLCDAGAKLGAVTFPWQAQDAGIEFFALIQNIGQRLSPPVSISEIWETNVAKLSARYKDGFSTEASIAKADERLPISAEGTLSQATIEANKKIPSDLSGLAKRENFTPGSAPALIAQAGQDLRKLSGEHQARHGCLGFPEVDTYATAGNGYRADCGDCDHPHHLPTKG